ncbi:MAG: hypothetical protein DHS20C11_18970 [Lysobacteraceae bacterium]|nr:MAG: hypothetical protein DHS20C11_18970 [Xanthomonadaceae bacterium]
MKGFLHILVVIALLSQAVAFASVDLDGCDAGENPHSGAMQHESNHHGPSGSDMMPMDCCDDGLKCAASCELSVQSAMVVSTALSIAQNTTGPRLDRLANSTGRSHPAPDLRPPISI